MAGLTRTEHAGSIVWLGRVPNRQVSLCAESLQQVEASLAGFPGETHGGLTRPSCSRVAALYPRGTEIRNARQLSIVSQEELDQIAAAIGLAVLDPAWIGASMVLQGIPDFSHVPPGARLQSESGTTLTVDLENGPCHFPGQVIEQHAPGAGKQFKAAARDRRGVTAWVERAGPLKLGDSLALHIPDQRPWQPGPGA